MPVVIQHFLLQVSRYPYQQGLEGRSGQVPDSECGLLSLHPVKLPFLELRQLLSLAVHQIQQRFLHRSLSSFQW